MSETPRGVDSWVHAGGPVHAQVCAFGERQDGPFDSMVVFGGAEPEPWPSAIREIMLGHLRRGELVLVITHSAAQQAWVKAQVAILTAPGGHA